MSKVVYVDQYISMPNYEEGWEDDMLFSIGRVAGTCYKSSSDDEACIRRALNCIANGHHSVFEHEMISSEIQCDRGTSHALVRHRHCAFTQNSTIYTKLIDHIEIIKLPETDPCTGKKVPQLYDFENDYYESCFETYQKLIDNGCPAGRARDVLPNSFATMLVMTTNIREWMYIAHRRCGPGDTERMHVFCKQLEAELRRIMPKTYEAFDKWYGEHPL